MQPEGPVEAQAQSRPRLVIRPVEGAPGDGGDALTRAITAVLKGQQLDLVTGTPGAADLVLVGEVGVAPPKAGKQSVKILWRVRHADGGEIGTVGQENDVPAGTLNGAWGDVAYQIAAAAGSGIMEIVVRGASQPTGRS